jgi:predicted acetyltransferase
MHPVFRLMVAAIAVVAFTHFSGTATAKTAVKQLKLTDKQVEGFIAAHKEMAAVSSVSGKADAKEETKLESIAKKHGFSSLDEYDDVEDNIMMIVDGIDPQTKSFTEPPAQIKKRIDKLQAELVELNEALKTAQPVQFRENIELLKKYWDKVDAVLQ